MQLSNKTTTAVPCTEPYTNPIAEAVKTLDSIKTELGKSQCVSSHNMIRDKIIYGHCIHISILK